MPSTALPDDTQMSFADAREIRPEQIEEAIGIPREKWAHDCHVVSLAIVRSGICGRSRVARGTCAGVMSQHSWVVLGDDCYDPAVTVLDATLWSYVPSAPMVYVGRANDWPHMPHGSGSILDGNLPTCGEGEEIILAPTEPLSERAQDFLDALGPLDASGWMALANSPVGGWPSAEIIKAMTGSTIGAFVPIDRVGMLTDLNPGGLYLP